LRSGLPVLEWIALSLLVSFSVATLSYRFVEKPFLRWRDKLLRTENTEEKKVVALLVPSVQGG
ncbi:MAG: hypothetical protein ACHQ1H_06895, partial [Nitrososphaerales archaeon]